MKKIRIFALVLVLGSVLVLSTACVKKVDVNQEELTPESQVLMEPELMEPLTEPSVMTPEELINQGEPQEVMVP